MDKKLRKAVKIASYAAIGLTLGITLGVAIRTQKDVLIIMGLQNNIAEKVLDLD